jgi:hypothetical protein
MPSARLTGAIVVAMTSAAEWIGWTVKLVGEGRRTVSTGVPPQQEAEGGPATV